MMNSTKPTGGHGSFYVGSRQSGLTAVGGALVTPFLKVAASAVAHRRREAQQAMKATLQMCWVKRRYCLAGITKLGERVAGITKLE